MNGKTDYQKDAGFGGDDFYNHIHQFSDGALYAGECDAASDRAGGVLLSDGSCTGAA